MEKRSNTKKKEEAKQSSEDESLSDASSAANKEQEEDLSQEDTRTTGPLQFDKGDKTSSWHTMEAHPKKVPTVTGRLMLSSFISVALTVVLLSSAAFFMAQSQHRGYVESSLATLSQSITDTLSLAYQERHAWTPSTVREVKTLSENADDIELFVTDEKGTTIYNDFISLEEAESPDSGNGVVVNSSEIYANGRVVGHVTLRERIPGTISEQLKTFFASDAATLFWIVAFLSIGFSLFMSFLLSRWIALPVRRITRTIQQLRLGNYKARTGLTGKDDLGQLGETLDAMASALERNSNAEHRLTSDVAHELRTPLMAIQVNVECMRDGVYPADGARLALVSDEVRRLSKLVDDMLTLSRLENDTAAFDMQFISLGQVCREIFDSQELLFESVDIKLEYIQEASDAQLMGDVDKDLITRAIVNLLSNAFRYSEPKSKVTFTVGREDEYIKISVADTGIGISPEDIEHVFSRFWRTDASRKRVSGGLGVGLSLVQEIVQKHKGYVNVESQLGKGSIFTIYIPTAS